LLNEKQQIYTHQLTLDPAEGPNAFWLSTPKPSSIPKSKHFWEQMRSLQTRPALTVRPIAVHGTDPGEGKLPGMARRPLGQLATVL